MLNIQVLGSGVVPRKGFLAPHKEPFPAELQEIGLILREPNLKINYLNPETGEFVALTRNNLMNVWEKYGKKKLNRPSKMKPMKATAPPMSPSIPDRKLDTVAVEHVNIPKDDVVIPKKVDEPAQTTPPNDDIIITKREDPKPETTVIEDKKVEETVVETVIKDTVAVEEDIVITDNTSEPKEEKSNTFTPKYGNKKKNK